MQKIIAAIIETLMPQHSHAELAETITLMHGRVIGMPPLLKSAMTILLFAFNACGIFYGGKPFHLLSTEARQRQMTHWQKSPFKFMREFIGFYQKMTLFIFYSLCPTSR